MSTRFDADAGPIIRVENFTAAYGKTVIIDDISVDIDRSEIFLILGGSGCGKSTLLKHMIGLRDPHEGHIYIKDKEISYASAEQKRNILKNIGVTYQSGALFRSMTLLDNIRLPMEELTDLPDETMNVIARMKLSLVGLLGFEHRYPSELSGGMQKRAAIARAMALDPSILFLDEPSAGLDPITSVELDNLILKLRDSLGITFVIVSHELASIYTIADRVILLDKRVRKIVAEGDPTYLRDRSTNVWVRKFFNREPEQII